MRRGFSLVEVLVCVGIVAIVAALVYPAFAESRKNARISSALARLGQIHLALKIYQENYGGDGGYGTPAEMNLPDVEQLSSTYIGYPESFWISPCVVDDPRRKNFTYIYFMGDHPPPSSASERSRRTRFSSPTGAAIQRSSSLGGNTSERVGSASGLEAVL